MISTNTDLDRPARWRGLTNATPAILFTTVAAITAAAFVMGNKNLGNVMLTLLLVMLALLLVTSGCIFLVTLLTPKADPAIKEGGATTANETTEEVEEIPVSLKLHPASPLRPQRAVQFHAMGGREFVVAAEFPDTQRGHSAAADFLAIHYGTAVLDKARGFILIGYVEDMGLPVSENTNSHRESSEGMSLIDPERG